MRRQRTATVDIAARLLAATPERHPVKLLTATTLATILASASLTAADREPVKRLNEAAAVFSEVMSAPDKGIPRDLLAKAHCVVIVPELKCDCVCSLAKAASWYTSRRLRSSRSR